MLAHRTLWSLVFFALLLLVQGRLGLIRSVFTSRKRFAMVLLSGVMISCNWFVFILSIQLGRAVEASLGYFIFPLVAVMLGAVVLGERMSAAKWGAIALVGTAVLLLSIGLGVLPWISLVLAMTFGLYGLLKKQLDIGPVVSVTAEVLLLSPLALIWLWGVHVSGWNGLTGENVGAFGGNLRDSLLLVLSGPLTAVPLMLFSDASKRVTLSTVGLVLYVNPTLQGLVAVLVLGEAFSGWHAIAFPLIWLALVFYSLEAWGQDRALRRAARKSGTVSTISTNSSTEALAKP